MTGKLDRRRLRDQQGISVRFSVSILIVAILVIVSYSDAGVVKGKVNSVRGDVIQLDLGADKGIKPGDPGRVYYNVTIDDKEKPIYVAKFRINRVSEGLSTAQIQEKTTEVRTGFLVEVTVREGEMEIRSEPAGAKTYVDGKEVGTAPLVLPHVKPGEYVVRLVREGYETYEEKVNVIEGERTKILASMKKAVGELSVNTDPPGAGIYLDGKSVGVSPYEGKDMAPRSYKIRITKEGYEAWEKEAVVEIGRKAEVFAQLKAMEGSLEIVSEPSGAKVYIDGNEIGETPLNLASMRLGQYAIRIVMEGYSPVEEKVEVRGKERRRVSVVLKKPVGELTVRTQPPGANIYIDGKPAGTTPYEGKGLSPGTYKIRIVKDGYGTWEGVLAVIPGRKVEVPIELKVKVGDLEIVSEPPGAKVYVNRKEMGQTPLFLRDIQLGQYLIRMVKEGYEPHEEEAGVTEGERKRIHASLKKIVGELSIRTDPPGASIYIDGKIIGKSPYQGNDLSPGAYDVRVVMEGYVPWEGVLAVIAGRRVEVPIELKAKLGDAEILSDPPGARVFVDGREMGQTPLSLSGIRLGQHQVQVSREGYEPHEERITIVENEKKRLNASLRRIIGGLSIRTDPLGASVSIDGKPVGTSPYEGTDLQPGTYKVKAVREGYETREMDVVVKAGESNKVRIELKEKKKEVAAPPPPAKPEARVTEVPKATEVPKVTETPKVKEAPKVGGGVDWAKRSCEAPVWNIGDKWTYRKADKGLWTEEVLAIREDAFIMRIPGVEELNAYDRKTMNRNYSIGKDGRKASTSDDPFKRLFEFPLSIGKKWRYTTSSIPRGARFEHTYINDFKVEGVEEIKTSAGTFKSYKLYCQQTTMGLSDQAVQETSRGWVRYWYSPEIKSWVRREFEKSGHWSDAFQDAELVSYELK